MVSPLLGARIAAHAAREFLRGETVVLVSKTGTTVATIDTAIVTIDPATVGDFGDGPAQHQGALRLHEDYHANALASLTATVRGMVWQIVCVGEVELQRFRVELRRIEENATNYSDISGKQAVWNG
jgi:hypothetical protein